MQYKKRVSRFSPSQFFFYFLFLFFFGVFTLFLPVNTLCVNVWQVGILSLHNTELTVVLLLCCCDLHIFRQQCVVALTWALLDNQKWRNNVHAGM